MNRNVLVIHQVTTMTKKHDINNNFYSDDQRLHAKLTVNLDDPKQCYLMFGLKTNDPVIIHIFLDQPEICNECTGSRKIHASSSLILPNSIDHWIERLKDIRMDLYSPYDYIEDESIISFMDSGKSEFQHCYMNFRYRKIFCHLNPIKRTKSIRHL